jgi:methionyl aminopeptidase
MRQAGLVVWEAHQIAKDLVRPGKTTGEIEAAVAAHFEKTGAHPLFKGVLDRRGKNPYPAVTCISINEEVVHGIPGPRVLREGDIVSIDTGCRLAGWCADSAYTHAVGKVSGELEKLLAVTSGVLDLAIELIGKSRRWSEVAGPMGRFVRENGFSSVESFVGHGIGRELHEEPQVPNFLSPQLRKNGDFPLDPGLVIAVEPMVNLGTKHVRELSDRWTQATQDGRASAHFEHTIAVTEQGPYILTSAPGHGGGPEGE